MCRRFSVVILVLLACSLSFSQASYRLKTRSAGEYAALQRQAVGMYCRLDFEGSRLTEQGWQKFKPLMYEANYPDFNVVEIVSRYQINPAETPSQFVVVSYNVLGKYQVGYGYTPAPDVRDVNFRVEDKKGDIVITEVEPNVPRVSKRVAVAWLKEQLQKSQNPIEKAQIEKSLQILEPPANPAAASETK